MNPTIQRVSPVHFFVAIAGIASLAALSGCATHVTSPAAIESRLITTADLPAGSTGPRVLQSIAPEFPGDLRHQGVEGEVRMLCLVDAEGRVKHVAVVDSSDDQFVEPAQQALRNWKFTPGTSDGRPVAMSVMIPIRFVFEEPKLDRKPLAGVVAAY